MLFGVPRREELGRIDHITDNIRATPTFAENAVAHVEEL
jgi:hypothetical protein